MRGKKAIFHATDLREWEKALACHEGVDFF